MIALPIDPTLTRAFDVVIDPQAHTAPATVDLDGAHVIIELHSPSEAQAVAAALAAIGPRFDADDTSRAAIRARMIALQALAAAAVAMADQISEAMGLLGYEHDDLIDAIFNGNTHDADAWLDDHFDEEADA